MTAKAAALLREHFEETVNLGTRRATGEVEQYRTISFEKLRPSVAGGFSAILTDLEHPPYREFAKFFGGAAYLRARQGFVVTSLIVLIDITEEILEDLMLRKLSEPTEQMPAIVACHRTCSSARSAIVDSFARSNQEYLAEANSLIEQLSSPLLPIYQGIIVLPLIGAVSAQRAQSILESLLNSVVTYRARLVIIDITGSAKLAEEAAGYLVKASRGAQLLGAKVILTGVNPEVAKTMASMSLELNELMIAKDLQSGLERALRERGLQISMTPRRT